MVLLHCDAPDSARSHIDHAKHGNCPLGKNCPYSYNLKLFTNSKGHLQHKPVGGLVCDAGEDNDDEADGGGYADGGASNWDIPVGIEFSFDSRAIECFRCNSSGPLPKEGVGHTRGGYLGDVCDPALRQPMDRFLTCFRTHENGF